MDCIHEAISALAAQCTDDEPGLPVASKLSRRRRAWQGTASCREALAEVLSSFSKVPQALPKDPSGCAFRLYQTGLVRVVSAETSFFCFL